MCTAEYVIERVSIENLAAQPDSALRLGRWACPRFFLHSQPKLICSKSMLERLDAVNSDNRNVELITTKQIRIAFNVNLIQRIFVVASGRQNHLFRFIAKMTTRTAVDN